MDLLQPTKILHVKRRSIALIINNKGEFIIRAPINAKESEIQAFIDQKKDWIITKRTQILESIKTNQLNLQTGNFFKFFGKPYTIEIRDCKTAKLKHSTLILPKVNCEKALINLLRRELRKYMQTRVIEIANAYGFNFKSISISSAKTNWGSCGASNTLNFTYKLALCPFQVIDYIIVHELCHTKVKNHSSKFWAEVKRVFPEYKQCEKWLKENRAIVNMI